MSIIRPLASALSLSACMLFMAAPAAAQTAAGNALAVCDDGQQDRQACRRELGAARQAAPQDPSSDFTTNALNRCAVHKGADARQACEDRVRGQQTQSQGSVFGGGEIHEHLIRRVGPAAN